MVMPMSSSRENSMFTPYDFDYASYEEGCLKNYGVRPRPRWITTEFGGHVSETPIVCFIYVISVDRYECTMRIGTTYCIETNIECIM